MIIQLPTQPQNHLTDGVAATNCGGDEISATPIQNLANVSSSSAPKKRAETWVQEETRALIHFRKEIDSFFNTSKSNKHLWENISLKMREKGFDRSPAMCTDKWRNLMKEFKKSKQNNQEGNGNGSSKIGYCKEIDEILKKRSRNGPAATDNGGGCGGGGGGGGEGSKVDAFMQFSDKGIDDVSLTFGPLEDNGKSTLNLETPVDHDGHPLAITEADAVVAASGASPWQWRETPGNGEQSNIYHGRVITVKLGDYIKRVGIDGTHDAIKDAIRSAFRLRTKRAFWLEDDDNVVRAIDRDMPLGNYTLHADEGLTIKICLYDEADQLPVHTENKTFYTEDDFRDFLSRRGWTCVRECNGCYRYIDSMDDLCLGAIYRGVN